MTDDEARVARALRVARFEKGFATGADPSSARRRVVGELASDPDWRDGMEAGREAYRAAVDEWGDGLGVQLALQRDPERYKEIAPDASVVDAIGRIKRHKFEPPHDEPSGLGPCWHCLRERGDKVHGR